MRLTAIVVLVFAFAASGCSQPPSQPATTTQNAAGAQDGAANSASATPPAAGSTGSATDPTPPAGTAAGNSGATALAPVSATTPGAAGGAAPAPAPPAFVEVTIPSGASLAVILDTGVASDTARVEQTVTARLVDAVDVNGAVALPAGSTVQGVVTAVERAGKVKGRAHLALRFTELTRSGDSERYRIQTASISRTAAATKGKDAMKVGGGALGGAIVGGIIGGKKGAAVGTAAGAGAGGAVVMSTRGEEVRLPAGSRLSVKLSDPLVVRVPAR